jgi:hypothetical protein
MMNKLDWSFLYAESRWTAPPTVRSCSIDITNEYDIILTHIDTLGKQSMPNALLQQSSTEGY